MAIAKFVAALLLALIALSMLQTMVRASRGHGGHHYYNTNDFGPGSLKSYQCRSQCTRRNDRNACLQCCKYWLCVAPVFYRNVAGCPC